MDNRNKPLSAVIVEGMLVIHVGVETLCNSVKIGLEAGYLSTDNTIAVTDAGKFAIAILEELTEEQDEYGRDSIMEMLDNAAWAAIEYGAEGVEIIERAEDE